MKISLGYEITDTTEGVGSISFLKRVKSYERGTQDRSVQKVEGRTGEQGGETRTGAMEGRRQGPS